MAVESSSFEGMVGENYIGGYCLSSNYVQLRNKLVYVWYKSLKKMMDINSKDPAHYIRRKHSNLTSH